MLNKEDFAQKNEAEMKKYLIDKYGAQEGSFTAMTEKLNPYVSFASVAKSDDPNDDDAIEVLKKLITKYSLSKVGKMVIRRWPKLTINNDSRNWPSYIISTRLVIE